ncbi:MAG: galactose-1-phosphate uridylyltransferase [Candidatus Freyarchaeota archaeon]
MTEIRKDYLLDKWVIVATERGKRPSDFKFERDRRDEVEKCPFCPGNEDMTPPASMVYIPKNGEITVDRDSDGFRHRRWVLRVVRNLYSALSPMDSFEEFSEGLTVWRTGTGEHEVIIETPKHDEHIQVSDEKQAHLVFRAYLERFNALKRLPFVKYVSIIRNYGRAAGASLMHPHSQLIAVPMIPERIAEEVKVCEDSWNGDTCIYDHVIESESGSERFISENKSAVAFCPFASTRSFEAWILPKRHLHNIAQLTEEELRDLASLTQRILNAYHRVLGDPPYNYCFQQTVNNEKYHLQVRLYPRLIIPAGFEINTGIIINPMKPEDAARYLREAV